MRKVSIIAVAGSAGMLLALTVGSGPAWPMPAEGRDKLAERLMETPAEEGGAKGLTTEEARGISDWMDTPAAKPRAQPDRARGELARQDDDGDLRENPMRAARAMSADGSADPARLNVARLHKIADVAGAKAPVDGWKVTDRMRREATKVLDEVERTGRLPKKLPAWVDASGPLVGAGAAQKEPGARRRRVWPGEPVGSEAARTAALATRVVRTAQTGAGLAVGRMASEGGQDTVRYINGDLTKGLYQDALVEDAIKAAGSGAVTAGVLVFFVEPTTAVVWIVATGACIVVDFAYDLVGDEWRSGQRAWEEFCRQLPPAFHRQPLLVELIQPDPSFQRFGCTYGPVIAEREPPVLAPAARLSPEAAMRREFCRRLAEGFHKDVALIEVAER